MQQDQWTAVDRYFTDLLVAPDAALDAALAANSTAGLPAIDVAPNQGKLLYLLALLRGARRVLEIGTLGGYSTIWLARAVGAGGRLVTLEFESKHAEVARSNIARAGLSDIVEIIVGPAVDSLGQLHAEREGAFDLIFIDADKQNNPAYFTWALRFSRKGTLIIVDNVVREGAVIETYNQNPSVIGTRTFFDMLSQEPRVSATALQTVGSKGYDGFAMALVISD
jgi:predicted O-methyltransferase YrrM